MLNMNKVSVEVSVSMDDCQCPHSVTMQCPSPKKGLAHAIVQCNIHLGRIVDPRILPCGHSFCFKCLCTLHQEQQHQEGSNQTHQKVSNCKMKLTCPLCRSENQFESFETLTVNYAIADLLEIFDAEEKEEERVWRETVAEKEHTVNILKSAGEKCLQILNLERNGKNKNIGCLEDAIIATEKRVSLLESLQDDIEVEKDRFTKDKLIRKLYYICLAHQRMAEMFHCEIQIPSGNSCGDCSERMNRFVEMYKSTVIVEYRPTETMSERRSRVWFSILFSLLSPCWSHFVNTNYSNAATLICQEFSKKFDDLEGIWISVIGKRPLGCWIWKNEHDYACLDISDIRLIIYRRTLRPVKEADDIQQAQFNKLLMEALQLKENDGWRDLNVAKYIRERIEKEFTNRFWHVAAGFKDQFDVSFWKNGEMIQVKMYMSQVRKWKVLVWEG